MNVKFSTKFVAASAAAVMALSLAALAADRRTVEL